MDVRLEPVTADNWRDVVDLEPRADQRRFVAPISRYLCLGFFDGVWNSMAIRCEDRAVGHVMWAYDDDEGAHWIGGLVVAAPHQGAGIGRRAVDKLIHRLGADHGALRFALMYHPENRVAAGLYRSMGFVETGEVVDDEVVARLPR